MYTYIYILLIFNYTNTLIGDFQPRESTPQFSEDQILQTDFWKLPFFLIQPPFRLRICSINGWCQLLTSWLRGSNPTAWLLFRWPCPGALVVMPATRKISMSKTTMKTNIGILINSVEQMYKIRCRCECVKLCLENISCIWLTNGSQPNKGCKIPIVLQEFRTLSANQCSFRLSFQNSILIESPNPENRARDPRVPCTVPVRQEDLTFRLDFVMIRQSVTSCPNDWLAFRVTRYSPAMLVKTQSVNFCSSWVQWDKEAHPK